MQEDFEFQLAGIIASGHIFLIALNLPLSLMMRIFLLSQETESFMKSLSVRGYRFKTSVGYIQPLKF